MIRLVGVLSLVLLIPGMVTGQSREETENSSRCDFDFVSHVTIPEGTMLSPGQSFTKTWRIRNSGSTPWSGCSLALLNGHQMSAPPSVPVSPTSPGSAVEISVPMTAPTEMGRHGGTWKMRNADGRGFGSLIVFILVEGSSYEGRSYEEWVADLQAHSPFVRQKALEALLNFGPRAVPSLIETYRNDPDEEVRVMAFGALADMRPQTEDTVRVFLEAVLEPRTLVGSFAYSALAGSELQYQDYADQLTFDRAVLLPLLIDAMDDTDPVKREIAIQLLDLLGASAKGAEPKLRHLAEHDPEPRVRDRASLALQWLEDQ